MIQRSEKRNRRVALLAALKTRYLDAADALQPRAPQFRAVMSAGDLTVEDALEVLATQPPIDMCTFIFDRIETERAVAIISALITVLLEDRPTMAEKVAAIKDELSLDSSLTFKAAVHEANKELGIEATRKITDQVAELICQLGINFAPAPATAESLREQRERRESAAEALGKIGEHAAPAVLALTKCFEYGDGNVREAAADTLGKFGEHAAPAVP